MTANHEVEIALAYAATLKLRECAVKSVEQDGPNSIILVVGLFTPEITPGDDDNGRAMAALLAEPFRVKIVVSGELVPKYEWVDIQFS